MKFAVKDDFLEITQLFQKYAKLFPHIRMGYINSRIEQNECIFSNGVVIIFQIHQSQIKIGKITKSQKSDCHLNQIFSDVHDESASRIIKQFFNYISLLPHASGVIYLNVRSDNDRAKKVRDTLLEQDYRAYLRQVKVGETIMYRVYVGPKFEKLELASIKSEIDKIFKVDSVILRYVP